MHACADEQNLTSRGSLTMFYEESMSSSMKAGGSSSKIKNNFNDMRIMMLRINCTWSLLQVHLQQHPWMTLWKGKWKHLPIQSQSALTWLRQAWNPNGPVRFSLWWSDFLQGSWSCLPVGYSLISLQWPCNNFKDVIKGVLTHTVIRQHNQRDP